MTRQTSSSLVLKRCIVGASAALLAAALLAIILVKFLPRKPEMCPISGEPPQTPDSAIPRCLAYKDLACCTQCGMAGSALSLLSTNGSAILGSLFKVADPHVDELLSSFRSSLRGLSLCAVFKEHLQCLNMIEALSCALTCDPAAGTYLSVQDQAGTARVCPRFAQELYDSCSTLTVPNLGQTLEELFHQPQDLLSGIVDPLVTAAASLSELSITVAPASSGSCFSGPRGSMFPRTNLCCDDLEWVPDSCFPGGAPGQRRRGNTLERLPGCTTLGH